MTVALIERFESGEISSFGNVEAEQDLLGPFLLNCKLFACVEGRLQGKHFSEPLHGTIFDVMQRQWDKHGSFSLSSIMPLLQGEAKIGDMTVQAYLARLAGSATHEGLESVTHAAADIVLHNYALREALLSADEATTGAYNAPDKTVDFLSDHMARLDEVLAEVGDTSERALSLEAATLDLISDIEAAQNGDLPENRTTGLKSLDRMTGGLADGNLVIVAGRPGMGKSALALSMALRVARAGEGALIFSLEVPAREISARACSDIGYSSTGSPTFENMLKRPRELNSGDLDRIKLAYHKFQEMPVTVDDHRGLNINQIYARARKHQKALQRQGKRLGLIVVDHIGKLASTDRYRGNRNMEVSEISARLADMAHKMSCTVIAVSQLSRGVESREDKRPIMSDLRDSGSLEQDAHLIIFPYREAYYLERQRDPAKLDEQLEARLASKMNLMEIIVAKNRNGRCGQVDVFCDIARNRLDDRSVR